jgi:hypothetical protein
MANNTIGDPDNPAAIKPQVIIKVVFQLMVFGCS